MEKIRLANLGKKRNVEFKEKMSELSKGSKWYTNGIDAIRIHGQCPEGYYPGRPKQFTDQFTYSTKDTVWINNGVINKRIKSEFLIPDGFTRGQLK